MSYRDNVQALCDEHGIDNKPIKEEDLVVKSLRFWVDGTGLFIPGTDMNRAGRLFFQAHLPPGQVTVCLKNEVTNEPSVFCNLAKSHFAEYWDDAEEVGRSMITAMKRAAEVEVHWKE